MSNSRTDFRAIMAGICVKRFSMSPASLPVLCGWEDWDDLYDAGYRAENSGEAFQEWIQCQ